MADQKISQLTAATTPLAGTEVFPIVQSSTTVKATIANVQAAPIAAQTADRILFLNGSKVPSTSANATFDGTNLGLGASPSFYGGRLAVGGHIAIASGNSLKIWNTGGSGLATLTSTGTNELSIAASAGTILTDGNLVIGTSGKGVDFSATSGTGTSELLADYEEGTWTPNISGDGGSAGAVAYTSAGYYTKVGRLVTLNGYVSFTNLGSWTGRVFVTGVPFSANVIQAYGSSLVTNATIAGALNLNCSIGAVSLTQLSFPWASSVGGGGDNVRFTNITATTFMTFSVTYMTA